LKPSKNYINLETNNGKKYLELTNDYIFIIFNIILKKQTLILSYNMDKYSINTNIIKQDLKMINNYSNTTKPKIILKLKKDKYNLVHTSEKINNI